jgi:IMP dehydrogenase
MAAPSIREIRRAYGFSEVAIVPGRVTINPDQTSTAFSVKDFEMSLPIIASAMDAVGSPKFASEMDKQGGLGVMNLEGLQTKHDAPDDLLNEIADAPQDQIGEVLRKIYSAPVREDLIATRIEQIKASGAKCAVSITPSNTKRFAPVATAAGADMIVVQSTVTTARHLSKSARGLIFSELLEMVDVPVMVGNCVTYDVALELMRTGIDGVIVGVGPGAACTTREVTGVGVPQVTATMDCAAARDDYQRESGRYVPIVTDGGIRTGGDLCKAVVAGADAVMIGTPLAQAEEAPGRGYNWGMASPDPALPRGTRVKVGVGGPLKQILHGPSSKSDGTQNLIGALSVCMGMVGAFTIQDMHRAEMVLAPSIKTEGKYLQLGLG